MTPTSHHHRTHSASRRGTLLPAIAFALLVVGGALALVLNALWKDAASVELRTAAEAAALAAAAEYLDDAHLAAVVNTEILMQGARLRAAEVASANRVAGQPLVLNPEPLGDVIFGTRLFQPQSVESVFLESTENPELTPDVVEVRATLMRSGGNPLRLFLPGVTGHPVAEAFALVQVAFDNKIEFFRPTPGTTVPCLPMGILARDPMDKRTDTWAVNIEQRQGGDAFRFDEETREVLPEPDGIPEIVLRSVPLNGIGLEGNVQMLDFRNDLRDKQLTAQIAGGLNQEALAEWGGSLPAVEAFDITASGNLTDPLQTALENLIGQQRLCLLYEPLQGLSIPSWSQVRCVGVVAIRILSVQPDGNETATLIVQPTIMSTRTAHLTQFSHLLQADSDAQNYSASSQAAEAEEDLFPGNRYVYKIFINR